MWREGALVRFQNPRKVYQLERQRVRATAAFLDQRVLDLLAEAHTNFLQTSKRWVIVEYDESGGGFEIRFGRPNVYKIRNWGITGEIDTIIPFVSKL